MSMAGSDLVLLKTCGDPAEAAALRSLLEANDIHCTIQGEQHRSMLGVMGGYIDVNVLVAERDLEKARALLQETETETPEQGSPERTAPANPDTEEAVCPVHGERSTVACKRCGTFLCARCETQGEPICEDCAERKSETHAVQRGGRRRLAAWVVLGILFGPVILMTLLAMLHRLLR
jgi:hypothetical protein